MADLRIRLFFFMRIFFLTLHQEKCFKLLHTKSINLSVFFPPVIIEEERVITDPLGRFNERISAQYPPTPINIYIRIGAFALSSFSPGALHMSLVLYSLSLLLIKRGINVP
jgi:hypothetical protein